VIRNPFRRRSGKTYVWAGADDRWYWKHVAANGREDNGGEQGYASRRYARKKARAAYPRATIVVLRKGEAP
jgi:hypothetical protein